MEEKAVILRIESLSPNDGPGLRTVVFFKGCPLRCAWCSTPESQNARPELYYQEARCEGCGRCVAVCPAEALSLTPAGSLRRNLRRCVGCMTCARACPNRAIGVYGEEMRVSQVMQRIRRDEVFYYHSGGGVTLSGGDVLQYPAFARNLLAACAESGIHTMAELDLYGDYERVRMLMPHLHAIFADIKMMDEQSHRKWTGKSNRSILANIRRVSREFPDRALHIRVPLVVGVNDDRENLMATALFCRELANCRELEFLPYHRLGHAVYRYLGRPYALADTPAMRDEEALETVSFLTELALPFPVKVAGKTLRLH